MAVCMYKDSWDQNVNVCLNNSETYSKYSTIHLSISGIWTIATYGVEFEAGASGQFGQMTVYISLEHFSAHEDSGYIVRF